MPSKSDIEYTNAHIYNYGPEVTLDVPPFNVADKAHQSIKNDKRKKKIGSLLL